jgi:phosphate transport system permease protein
MNFRKTVEKLSESVLLISSMVTTVTVLFIIYFLFKSGVGLFNDKTVDENHSLVVSINNPVNELSSKQLKDIFNGDITNWSEVGGKNSEIELISIDEIYNYYSEEQLGSNFENMPVCVNDFFSKNDHAIGYFENKFITKNFPGKIVKTSKITLKEFFTGREWYPTAIPSAQFGVLPLIMGTLWVTFLAILFALPIGLITAIYMAEIASERVRKILKPVIELLAGIPSVVFGFFGLVVLVPFIQQLFSLPVGETALAGSIILGIMALPTIITVSEDAIRSTPVTLKEASLALGASHWQSIKRVILPAASSGILASFILGIGRAIGETMAVLMVTGNAAIMPKSFLEPVRTIPATIAAELGEAPFGGTHFKALFALGIILFVITFIFNTMVEMIKKRKI